MTPLAPDIQSELAKLRDIRLPEPIGWWPLAPGWWVLIAIVFLCILVGLVLEFRRRRTLRHAALRELAGLKARLDSDAATPDVATDLAVLMRRFVLRGPEARKLGAVSGPDWAAELGRGPGGMSEHIAALIANAPYTPTTETTEDVRKAVAEAEIWIRRHS